MNQDRTRPANMDEHGARGRDVLRHTPAAAGDARGSDQKQKQNREHLRVGEDHQTPEMKKHHRGTFP